MVIGLSCGIAVSLAAACAYYCEAYNPYPRGHVPVLCEYSPQCAPPPERGDTQAAAFWKWCFAECVADQTGEPIDAKAFFGGVGCCSAVVTCLFLTLSPL